MVQLRQSVIFDCLPKIFNELLYKFENEINNLSMESELLLQLNFRPSSRCFRFQEVRMVALSEIC